MSDVTLPPPTDPHEAALRDHALAYPEAIEHFPWGERAIKVRGKVFVFLSRHDGALNVTTKLPHSHEAALFLAFASPTGYGLGRSGWVSARFAADEAPPVELLRSWIDESYRAVAPRHLVENMTHETGTRGPEAPTPAAKTTAPLKGAAKKTTAEKATAEKATKKATAKKATAKKATAKKATAKKATAKKATAKKATAKKATKKATAKRATAKEAPARR